MVFSWLLVYISATVKLYFSAKENSETMGQRGGITGISLVILSRDYNQSARVWLIWNAMNLVSLERPPKVSMVSNDILKKT